MTNQAFDSTLNYGIIYKGVLLSTINSHLIKVNGLEHKLEEIKSLHIHKLLTHDKIREAPPETLKDLAVELTHIEYKLQDAWGFPRNEKFHRFWETPRCSCPKLDNGDRYPYGYYVVNLECPLHGNIAT